MEKKVRTVVQTTTTTITSNGTAYEIRIFHDWLDGIVTCMDDVRSYVLDADLDAESVDEAIAKVADWCEWHSAHREER